MTHARVPIVVIAGATASGKTALGVKLAQQLRAEVVSADSVQIYRELVIGSARPTDEEMQGVPHHLLGMVDLRDPFDAAQYVAHADAAIADITSRGRRALVVGGTGLYLRALVRGLAEGIPSDPAVRAELNARAAMGSTELALMHAELASVDPVYARAVHPNDPIRIVRGLEVHRLSGMALSEHHARHAQQPDRYRVLWIGLDVPRPALAPRIAVRTQAMLQRGWVDEVRSVLAQGFSPELKPLRSVGYAQVVAHVLQNVALDETERRIVQETKAFAKRQYTWFHSEKTMQWHTPEVCSQPDFAQQLETFFNDAAA